MTAWWVEAIAAIGVVLVFAAAPVIDWLERRADRRDREAWSRYQRGGHR